MFDAMLPYRVIGSDSSSQKNTFVEGVVYDVTAEGMRFTVPSWDNGKHVFGPAPWPVTRMEPSAHVHSVTLDTGSVETSSTTHSHGESVPNRGARALVLFLGGGIENPWVVGWWAA